MLGVASGAVLVPLNSTMLAVALPSIMDQFGVDAVTVSSLVTLYLGAVTVALPASGSLGDRFGQRRVFLAGVVAFALSSLLPRSRRHSPLRWPESSRRSGRAGLDQLGRADPRDVATRAAWRGVRPLRHAGLDECRDRAVRGGVLVGAFGWRSSFVIAVPVALFAALMVGLVVRPDRVTGCARRGGHGPSRAPPRPIDIPGLALLAVTLIALLAAIRAAGDGGSGSLAAVAVIPLAFLFVRFELASDHPAVDPRLFTIRPFAAAVLG
jgi:MFS family permease